MLLANCFIEMVSTETPEPPFPFGRDGGMIGALPGGNVGCEPKGGGGGA
jgi:hypothetical protein